MLSIVICHKLCHSGPYNIGDMGSGLLCVIGSLFGVIVPDLRPKRYVWVSSVQANWDMISESELRLS